MDLIVVAHPDDEVLMAGGLLAALESEQAMGLLASLIFWDEKRPIKTGILNVLDWSRLHAEAPRQAALI